MTPGGGPSADTTTVSGAETRQIRGSALLLAGALLSSGLDFVAQVVLVRYLSKDAFGAWSYVLALVFLLSSVAQLEMRNAAARFIPVYVERGDRPRVLGTVLLTLGTAVGLGSVIALMLVTGVAFLHLQPTGDPLSLHLLVLVAALIPVHAIDNVFTGVFAALGASRMLFIRQSLLGPVLRVGLVLGVVALGASIEVLAVGYVVVTLLGVVLFAAGLVNLLDRDQWPHPGSSPALRIPVREVLSFAAPLLTTTLVWTLMESSDALLLGYFRDTNAVADFRVVLPLARMNTLVAGVFATLYLPLASQALERGDAGGLARLYWRSSLWMTILSLPIFLLTVPFATPVTVGLYGQRYADSAPILALVSTGYFFNTVLGFNGLTVKIHGRLRYTVALDIAAAVVNVALNLILIPAIGPLGAAIGTCTTLIVHNVLKHVALARLTPVPWFDRRYLAVYARLVAIAAVAGVVQLVVNGGLIVAILTAGIASLVAVAASRTYLDPWSFFPEVARLPLPAWLVGLFSPRDAVP